MAEASRTVRLRTKVSTTSKGLHSYEHTVEITDDAQHIESHIAEVLAASDDLERKLQERYPVNE